MLKSILDCHLTCFDVRIDSIKQRTLNSYEGVHLFVDIVELVD